MLLSAVCTHCVCVIKQNCPLLIFLYTDTDNSTSLFFSCPVLEDDAVGVCADTCWTHSDCNSSQKCCRNGCSALTCTDPVPIPYISPPRDCPKPYQVHCGTQNCADSCEDPQKHCCLSTCGYSVCEPLFAPFPCTTLVKNITMGEERLGQYVPQCKEEDVGQW